MDRSAALLLAQAGFVPGPQVVAPRTPDEAGLSVDLLTQLTLKTLFFAGELSGADVAKRLGVLFGVIEPSLEFLRVQHHVEISGGAIVGGASYRYRVTMEGRSVASLYLQQSHYVGPAPVPIVEYRPYMTALRDDQMSRVTPADVRAACSHLVLSDIVLDAIGPAVNGGHSVFIYGPPGNGKTVLARAIRGLLTGDIAIPYAVEVEGHIIRVFDPANHEPRALSENDDDVLALGVAGDRRWTICRRPLVTAGGELTLESLELTYDRRLGYHRAPLQWLANGGLFIVDDFGRQHCAPRDLLNRWMVPLESGVDYLTLQSGQRFQLPFHVLIAFATNLRPAELVDEAFLRRIQYKVFADNPSRDDFVRIFERCCGERDLTFDRQLVEQLLDDYYRPRSLAPRACHPRDLINQALLFAEYRGLPRELTPDLLAAAFESYFVDERP